MTPLENVEYFDGAVRLTSFCLNASRVTRLHAETLLRLPEPP